LSPKAALSAFSAVATSAGRHDRLGAFRNPDSAAARPTSRCGLATRSTPASNFVRTDGLKVGWCQPSGIRMMFPQYPHGSADAYHGESVDLFAMITLCTRRMKRAAI